MVPKAILMELSDVVLEASLKSLTAIPVFTFKSILHCAATHTYQRGELSRPNYFRRLQMEFDLCAAEVECAFDQVQATYAPNTKLLSFLKELKSLTGDLKIYAFANIGKEDYACILNFPVGWGVFDFIFTSSKMNMRKPDFKCFAHVLRTIGKSTEDILFVDKDTDNVMAAISLGMKGMMFESTETFRRDMLNAVLDPIGRAKSFLYRNRKNFNSVSANGILIHENFAQLMILEATGDE
jgi:FMN phosphatase YigB (HAD superfamily)